MRKRLINIFPTAIIILIVISFFSILFINGPKIFVFPDFGGSDVLDFNYPIRFNLSNNLKNNQIPLWTRSLGMGYPIFAEGQTGTFNIFILLLFRVLPPLAAFNLQYIIIFCTSAFGTYFYLLNKKVSKSVSLFSSIVFSFSGFFIGHLNHLNLIQTASFLPWLFLFSDKIFTKPKFCTIAIFSFILSQQYFSGFPQLTFISLFGILIYQFIHAILERKFNYRSWISLFIGIFLGITLSAIQILPTIELVKNSDREYGVSYVQISKFPFLPKHFVNFIFPFKYGNPKIGSFDFTKVGTEGIFWENTCYVGILPLILTFILLIKKKKKTSGFSTNEIKSVFLLSLISILFLLGKNSPLYLILTIPPFNFFRVPSRYLILLIWSITTLSAISFQQILTNNTRLKKTFLLQVILISILIIDLILNFGTNSLSSAKPAKDWIDNVETAKFINKLPPGRIKSLFSSEIWINTFISKNWAAYDKYLFYRNFIRENSNLIYGIDSSEIYSGLFTKRHTILGSIGKNFNINKEGLVSPSISAMNIIDLEGVRYLISPYKINSPNIELLKSFHSDETFIYIYENKKTLPRIRTVNKYKIVNTVEEITTIFNSDKFYPQEIVYIENDHHISLPPKMEIVKSKISSLLISDNKISVIVETNNPTFLVINQSFYPGWKAFIDGKEENIFAANLNEQAVLIQKGKHAVKLIYDPESYEVGKIITLISLVALVFMFFIKIKDHEV